ncbi:MAG: peptide ABC transporter substrate-binding protein [Verrucomicrobia bacterium]|nr:peptide ABC transporter substrate-binding protein [Verrucomicrobiota bacterium]
MSRPVPRANPALGPLADRATSRRTGVGSLRILARLPRLLCAALAGLSLAGCLKRETAVQRGNREQVLHRGVGNEVTELDPHLVTGVAEGNVLRALFEGLVTEDPVDLRPVPGVAERWELSPDGLVYTFFLRANARWSNGEPVTAQDFVTSFRRILTPSLAADYANLLYILQGAEAFHKGTNPDFSRVGATALDPRTLRLTLEHPAPYFLSLLTNPPFYPVPLATISRHGSAYQRGNPWTRPGRIVTNGAFTLQKWQPHQVIVVEKFAGYWDAATVRLNAIHFYPIDSVDAEERAFRAGQLHLTEFVPVGKIDAYRRDSPHLLRTDPYLGTYFFRFNVRRPPLNDVRVRRAFALAVDREAIVTKVLRGGQRPAHALTPPGTAGYTAVARVPTDFAAARQVLAEAGFPGGRGFPTLELLYNTSENHRIVAEAIQEMWRRELGIEVRLTNQEMKVTQAARRAGEYQILRSDWIGDYLDPATFLEVFRSDSGNNYTGWSHREYDAALFAAARTADPVARAALLQKAEAILLAEVPFLPLYHYTHVFLLQPSVKGWHHNLLDHHPYKHVWLEP